MGYSSCSCSVYFVCVPNHEEMRTDYAVKIPYALGLIATRSTTKEVTGLKDLMQQHEVRIRNGMLAYAELENYVQVIVHQSY